MSEQAASSATGSQYSMQSILWIMTAVALLMAYARNLGSEARALLVVYATMWVVCLALFALFTRDRKSLVFWSGLIVIEAFLAVSAVRLLNTHLAQGWGAVAAVSGTLASVSPSTRLLGFALVNSLLSFLAMMGVLRFQQYPLGIESVLDLVGAAGVGFTLTYFVHFLKWFTAQTRQPWPVVAAWLTTCVLVGNLLMHLSGY